MQHFMKACKTNQPPLSLCYQNIPFNEFHELYVFHVHRLLSSAHFDCLPFPSQMFFLATTATTQKWSKKDSTNSQLMKHFHSQTNVVFLLCDISIDKNKQVPLSTIYPFHHNFVLHSNLLNTS